MIMKLTLRISLLTLFAAAATACNDNHVAAADPCSSDADCGKCQVCSSGSCVPDPQSSCQPTPTLLTIQGSVTIPNAVVEVEHAGTTVAAVADDTGDFVIEIPEPASTVPLLLRARHASESSFELVSLLPDSATLVDSAGSILSQDEHPGTRITPLSTAVYGTMKAGFGRAPQSAAEKSEAEHSMRSVRDGAEIVRLAAALQLIIEDPAYNLPAGNASTVALAEDLLGARAVLEGLAAQPGGDPTSALVEAMLADPIVVTPYRTDRQPPGYYDLTLRRNGLVGRGGDRWELYSNGTGVTQSGLRRFDWQLYPFGWKVTAAGDLELSYVVPQRWFPGMSVEQIVAFYPDDVELQQQIRTVLSSVSSHLWVGRAISISRFIRLWAGQAVDLIGSRDTITIELGSALAPYGVTAPDVQVTEEARIELLLREDALPRLPWTRAMATGTRLMQVLATADMPDSMGHGGGDLEIAAAQVDFVDGTTAVAIGGASSTPLTLGYEVLSNGLLRLTYPTGETQTVAILIQQGEELGLLNTFVSLTDGTFTRYDRSVRLDPASAPPMSQLVNGTDQYWQTTLYHSTSLPTSTGELPFDTAFGFSFGNGGLADRIRIDYVDPYTSTDPYLARDETLIFQVDQGVIRLLEYKDRDGPCRCDPSDEPSCFLGLERTWQPLVRDGGLLYVLESEKKSRVHQLGDWDDEQQAWIDRQTGLPIDPEAVYGWRFLPRINAYYVSDVPAP